MRTENLHPSSRVSSPYVRARRQPMDRVRCNVKERRVHFNADAFIPQGNSSSNSRTPTHKWIQDNSCTKRETGTDDLTHKRLRLQRGVRRKGALFWPSRGGGYDIAEGNRAGDTAKASCFPFSKIILHSSL